MSAHESGFRVNRLFVKWKELQAHWILPHLNIIIYLFLSYQLSYIMFEAVKREKLISRQLPRTMNVVLFDLLWAENMQLRIFIESKEIILGLNTASESESNGNFIIPI